MPDGLYEIVFSLNRWLHLVCMTLIVGGTLFYELVVPASIDDLKREQQFFVFARARLVFRWVVWIAVIGLLITGALALWRMWRVYQEVELTFASRWAVAHMVVGAMAMLISLLLTIGRQPPENPVWWMRLNLIILLVVIFLGSATRHFQLSMWERPRKIGKVPDTTMSDTIMREVMPATQPTTR